VTADPAADPRAGNAAVCEVSSGATSATVSPPAGENAYGRSENENDLRSPANSAQRPSPDAQILMLLEPRPTPSKKQRNATPNHQKCYPGAAERLPHG
jgi:hypothetical protein